MNTSVPEHKPTNSDSPREPIFKNLPIGTILILLVIGAIFVARIGEPEGGTYVWAANLQLISQKIALYLTEGTGGTNELWTLISYQFLHAGRFHIVMNAAMLLQVGPICEIGFIPHANLNNYANMPRANFAQKLKMKAALLFILYFLACGIIAALGFVWLNSSSSIPLVGASGSISGIFAGYLWSAFIMAPRGSQIVRPLAESAIVFLVINVGLAALVRGSNLIAIAWEAHLFGFLAGLVLYPLFYRLSRTGTMP
ncbi:MAG: rhomboid family protein [Hyphomonadaceae bacterium]|nr:MAG: rhomboid family protein [Hyphomonadaceae bacterium]KAF0185092.1 MAG: rhomboid family protein [Hyphomonadaceae bacterium]